MGSCGLAADGELTISFLGLVLRYMYYFFERASRICPSVLLLLLLSLSLSAAVSLPRCGVLLCSLSSLLLSLLLLLET